MRFFFVYYETIIQSQGSVGFLQEVNGLVSQDPFSFLSFKQTERNKNECLVYQQS